MTNKPDPTDCRMLHRFSVPVDAIPLPGKFTNPFCYTPHPLCVLAAGEVKAYLATRTDWAGELRAGKMFGVLVVRDEHARLGYLAAYSGILDGRNDHPFFVPPVYDLLHPGGHFKTEEEQISAISRRIHDLEHADDYRLLKARLADATAAAEQELLHLKARMKAAKAERETKRQTGQLSMTEADALVRESQFQKAEYKRRKRAWEEQLRPLQEALQDKEAVIAHLKDERKRRSADLQQWLFAQFSMLNGRGEARNLCDIFAQTVHQLPPAGAGECAAPKLLQQAYLHGWTPLAMAEFWWGDSPHTDVRHHGHYYPACKGKCEPILKHMLQGLDVEEAVQPTAQTTSGRQLEVVYEDDWLVAVCKPAGMLSVPGKVNDVSVYSIVRERYPQADGPLLVHRLDMDTSGLLLVAKTKPVHQALQAQFKARRVKKRYLALLDGWVEADEGVVSLPLAPNPLDRPRQMVDAVHGKPAVTRYQVVERTANAWTRIYFFPQTGRTHQLRVHAAHPQGLHCPICGDRLYGKAGERLYLHAEVLEFTHPVTREVVHIECRADF